MEKTHTEYNAKRCNNFISKLGKIATPFLMELPYICFFVLLMGGFDAMRMIAYKFLHGFILNDLVVQTPSFLNFFGRISILFLFSYIGAVILTLIKSKKVRIGIKTVFYTIVLILFLIVNFLKENFNLEINPTCFVLLTETTGTESQEFINQYIFSKAIIPTLMWGLAIIVLVITAEYFWCYVQERLKNRNYYLIKILPAFLLPILLFGLFSSNIYWRIYNAQTPDHIRLMSPPKDPFSSVYASLITLRMMEDNMQTAIKLNESVYESGLAYHNQKDSINIVVVIGESYIKSHSQLYGYELATTPNLCREENEGRLFVFDDVISSSNSTSIAMRNILCCNNSSADEQWYDYPNFMTIFKQSGYNVYFWDNQLNADPNATYSFTLNAFLYNNSMRKIAYTETNEKSYQYDNGLLDDYREKNDVSNIKYNLTILHLLGQHIDYAGRFPHDTFKHFTADSIKRTESYLGEAEKDCIADYDNATLYNDYVLNEIIDTFRDTNTILLYFSDHGEEVYDYRKMCGRDHGTFTPNMLKYQYNVPFMVWCSDIYKAKNPEVVNNIKNAVKRPFMTDNICHMLFNVAGIVTPYYRDSLDLISPNYKCNERILHRVYRYEDICCSR